MDTPTKAAIFRQKALPLDLKGNAYKFTLGVAVSIVLKNCRFYAFWEVNLFNKSEEAFLW